MELKDLKVDGKFLSENEPIDLKVIIQDFISKGQLPADILEKIEEVLK